MIEIFSLSKSQISKSLNLKNLILFLIKSCCAVVPFLLLPATYIVLTWCSLIIIDHRKHIRTGWRPDLGQVGSR